MAMSPCQEGQPALSDDDKQLVINVQLPILGGHLLMGTDVRNRWASSSTRATTSTSAFDPDTRAEADTLFAALSAGGKVEQPMQEMFWGDYFGSLVDKFGVQWMINCTSPS